MDKDFSPKISVIVPVYNVEKYLRKCLDSILSQTFTDFELILIDDGSPDNSGKICDEYAKRDKRITVIHQKNGGQSNARNTGLDLAKGKYVYFCDSDDYISPFLLETVYNKAESGNFDQVRINAYNVMDGNIKEGINHIANDYDISNKDSKKKFITELFLSYSVGWETWVALFKKSVIDEHNIRFYDGINLAEDTCFNLMHLYYCNAVAVLPDRLYYYLLRGDSTTGQAKVKNRLYEKIKLFSFVEKATPENLREILPYFFITITAGGLWNKTQKLKKDDYARYKEIINRLENTDEFENLAKNAYFALKRYNRKKYGFSFGGKINSANRLLFDKKYFFYKVKWCFYSLTSYPERVINKITRKFNGKKNG